MKLQSLALAVAVVLLAVSIAQRLTRGPGLVDWSENFGFPAFLDERIRVLRAGEWGMGWTIKPGDLVLWVEVGKIKPSEGDIILYKQGGQLVAHRIISVEKDGFRTKGDNQEPDNYIVTEPVGIVIGVIYK
ncbi:MAG: hypothetical protein QXW77_02830 [Candidatus Hadarchaeales archaeon]